MCRLLNLWIRLSSAPSCEHGAFFQGVYRVYMCQMQSGSLLEPPWCFAGKDATEEFDMLHDRKVIKKYGIDEGTVVLKGTLKKWMWQMLSPAILVQDVLWFLHRKEQKLRALCELNFAFWGGRWHGWPRESLGSLGRNGHEVYGTCSPDVVWKESRFWRNFQPPSGKLSQMQGWRAVPSVDGGPFLGFMFTTCNYNLQPWKPKHNGTLPWNPKMEGWFRWFSFSIGWFLGSKYCRNFHGLKIRPFLWLEIFVVSSLICTVYTWSFQSKSYTGSEAEHVGMAKDQDDETHKNISSLADDILADFRLIPSRFFALLLIFCWYVS